MSKPRIGGLRHRLVLERGVRAPDGGGGATRNWSAVAEIWAAIEPATGTESVVAEAISGRVSHAIYIRHRNDVLPAMRLRFGDRHFDIQAVLDVDNRRRFLKCLAQERGL